MSTGRLNITTSGMVAIVATICATTIDWIAPINLFNVSLEPNSALAQGVDEQTNIQVYQRASPAVVSIEAGDTTGSGSIISPDGLVLTNAHVVQGSQTVRVILADGRPLQAEVVAFDRNNLDLAVVKIPNQRNLPTIQFAQNPVQVGQRAFAIGNPFGRFQGTFTVGIVSRIDGDRGLIQTDAAINFGNSGGPLLNSQGELIGVNSAIFTDSLSGGNIGIGFAIAIDRVLPFLADVQARRAPRTAVRREASSGALRPQPLVLNGSLLTGRLDQRSNILPFDNSFFDLYIFEGRAGQRVQIDMISEQINPYLILLNSQSQEIAQDNDSGSAANSQIIVTLPGDGIYLLMANSYEAGQAGAYRLRAQVTTASVGNSSNGANFILQQQGILSSRDAKLPSDGSLFTAYSFEGRTGQSVTINLASPDFDPFLAVLDPDGRIIAQNDDISQTDNNSQLTLTLSRTGTYQVIVNAFGSDGRGRYMLTIR